MPAPGRPRRGEPMGGHPVPWTQLAHGRPPPRPQIAFPQRSSSSTHRKRNSQPAPLRKPLACSRPTVGVEMEAANLGGGTQREQPRPRERTGQGVPGGGNGRVGAWQDRGSAQGGWGAVGSAVSGHVQDPSLWKGLARLPPLPRPACVVWVCSERPRVQAAVRGRTGSGLVPDSGRVLPAIRALVPDTGVFRTRGPQGSGPAVGV